VAVLDIRLPGLQGVDLLKRLKRAQPDLRVLIFSGYESPTLIREVIAAGALGFVEKTAGFDEFKKGLDAVGNGQTYYGPAVTALLRDVVESPSTSKTHDFITDREREVLKLVAESHSTKEIALKLKISPKTVDNHRTNLMRKLRLHDVASLTRHAIDIGLVFNRSER
jgi:DNA-binding NarL/FixJ family response regulator